MRQCVWIGFDPREVDGFAVTRASLRRHSVTPIPTRGLVLASLQARGLYFRPTERRCGCLWDVVSEHPMATEFAVSRFLVPIMQKTGWGLFMDSDMLVRADIQQLFDLADPKYAVMCVKHPEMHDEGFKMDGQIQSIYARKNWSSVMLFNCDHPANKCLTLDRFHQLPGRDLHRFCWLEDEEIGELPPEWNHLVGHHASIPNPRIVHFTDGIPSMPGYESQPWADEWRAELERWAL